MRKMVNKMTLDPSGPNFHQAMRAAVTGLTQQGISIIQYDNKRNPYSRRLDSSVRVALSGEMNQIVNSIQDRICQDVSFDAREVSVEIACAPDHIGVEGMVFDLENWELLLDHQPCTDIDSNHHHLPDRTIGEFNCRHIGHLFMLNVSERNFTQDQIDARHKENLDGIEWNGKQESLYSMTQKMRQNETEQRRQRGTLEIIRQVSQNDPAFRQDIKHLWASIKALDTDYKAMGKTLDSHKIIMKPGRKYNINARAFR
jgi:hypothetical protein